MNPIGFSSPWMSAPSRAAIGSVPIVRWTSTGAFAPDFLNAALAAATFAVRWHGIPFVAAKYGLAGGNGKQPGCCVPPKTTLLISLRSSASSNACLRSADFANVVPMFS